MPAVLGFGACTIAYSALRARSPETFPEYGHGLVLALWLGGYIYLRLCWQVRRLHDLGKSGWIVLSAVAWQLGRGLVPFAGMAVSFELSRLLPESRNDLDTYLHTGAILSIIAGAIAAYHIWGYRRHQKRWQETVIHARGTSGANRFGPSPL